VIADKDPFVGRALDLFLPELEVDPTVLLAAARADAAGLRAARRRRQTVLAVAFATLLLLAGAAVAAQKLDLLPFLHTNDRNAARFSINPSRRYRGAAPLALTCATARNGRFVCNVSGPLASGKRQYALGMRTDKVPLLSRQSMLAALTRAQAQGADPAQVARVRSDLDAVDDDFIRALAVVARIETVSGGGPNSPSGTERVPPAGVPAWAACRELTLTTYRCRPLAALTGVASGTPLYFLQPSADWRRVKGPQPDRFQFDRLLERVLGRKPNAAETRFFIDFATVAVGSGGGPTKTVQGTPIAVSDAQGAARLAAQSLGVRTRVVSVTVRPLPHRRLPGGLRRSSNVRLYRVVLDLLRANGIDKPGRNTIYVYVTRSAKLGVWRVAWLSQKP